VLIVSCNTWVVLVACIIFDYAYCLFLLFLSFSVFLIFLLLLWTYVSEIKLWLIDWLIDWLLYLFICDSYIQATIKKWKSLADVCTSPSCIWHSIPRSQYFDEVRSADMSACLRRFGAEWWLWCSRLGFSGFARTWHERARKLHVNSSTVSHKNISE